MTLRAQYEAYLEEHLYIPYETWLDQLNKQIATVIKPIISDDFQIGEEGAYEAISKDEAKDALILLYERQIMVISKIELGDDVISEIRRLKSIMYAS